MLLSLIEGEQVHNTGGEISITRSTITNSIQEGIVIEENALKSLSIVDTAISSSRHDGIRITGGSWSNGLPSTEFVLKNCVIDRSRIRGLDINSGRLSVIKILNTTVSSSGSDALRFNSYGIQKSLFIIGSKFLSKNYNGLSLYFHSSTNFVVENCAINETSREGIYIYSYNRDNVIRIVNSSVTYCGDRGLAFSAGVGRSFISGNTFAWNRNGAIYFYNYYRYSQSVVLVDSNDFFYNEGPSIEIFFAWGTTYEIVKNTFKGNRGFSVIAFGTPWYHYYYYRAIVTVSSNLFSTNNCTGKAVIDIRKDAADFVISENYFASNIGRCLLLEGSAVHVPISVTDNLFHQNECEDTSVIEVQRIEENATFANNTFTQNMAESVIHLQLVHNFPSSLRNKELTFFNNTISNNFGDKSPRLSTDRDLCAVTLSGFLKYKDLDFRFNRFNNPKYRRELCIRVPAYSQRDVVNVSLNWWGTANGSRVRDRISDFDVNNDIAIANTSPYLLSGDDQTTISVDGHDLKQYGHVLSGRLFKSLTLEESLSPFFVTSDFTVLENVTLTIEAGVTIKVSPGSSVLVAGELQVRGTLFKPVILTVKEPDRNDDASQMPVRLVGSDFPWMGWLELHYNKSWRPLAAATISTRWNIEKIVCKQLGYAPPVTPLEIQDELDQNLNGSRPIKVLCHGNETFIHECLVDQPAFNNNNNNNSLAIAVKCQGATWGNMRFTSSIYNVSQGQSTLEHVEFSFCGNHHGKSVPAIEAVINVPVLRFVTVKNCIAGGLRVYFPRTDVHLNNSKFINTGETGDGISFVQTGRKIVVENTESISNRIGLSIDESRTENAPRVHYGQLFLCGEEESVLVKNQMLLYFEIPLETKVTASGTCQKVLTVPDGRGIKMKLLYSKGTQRLQVYGSIYWHDLIFDKSNSHLASFVHKDLFIPRDKVFLQWTGDVSSQMAIQVEVTSVNGKLLSY